MLMLSSGIVPTFLVLSPVNAVVCCVVCCQLFMIASIRDYILTAEGAADELIETEEMDDKLDNEVSDIVISRQRLGMLSQRRRHRRHYLTRNKRGSRCVCC